MDKSSKDKNPVILGYKLRNVKPHTIVTSLIFILLIGVLIVKTFTKFKGKSYWAGMGLFLLTLYFMYAYFFLAMFGGTILPQEVKDPNKFYESR